MSEGKFTPGPWDWQKFGEHYFLTGQYGMRPIVLSFGRARNGKSELKLLKEGLLVPFTPDHPDARLIAAAPEMFEALAPDELEAIASELDSFKDSARAHSLRVIANQQRAALAKAQWKGEAS